MTKLLIVFFLIISSLAYSQLPKKVKHLAGNWEYLKGSGREHFVLDGDTLKGTAFLQNKFGESIAVETISIREVNGNLVYTTKSFQEDSLKKSELSFFVSRGKKTKFYNTEAEFITAMKYKVACFNKNRLTIIMYCSNGDKKKLKLRAVE